MIRKTILTACLTMLFMGNIQAATVNTEKTLTVNGVTRKYILYVPDNVKANPSVVFSLHGASGHDTDRSPFRTSVAAANGCIVVYPQGANQYFAIFGGSIPGWNSTGTANEDLDFFKAIIEDVTKSYTIDHSRIYCCGFSNGGMMTYANTAALRARDDGAVHRHARPVPARPAAAAAAAAPGGDGAGLAD